MSSGPPNSTIVVLGASNVTRGLPTVVAAAEQALGAPLRFLIAAGRGRSFGIKSTMLLRSLPGILSCGLWNALHGTAGPIYALITDVGNDLLYGNEPATVAAWVEETVKRLQQRNARTVIAGLPLERIRKLTPASFQLAKSILFPLRTLSFEAAVQNACELNDRILQLAKLAPMKCVVPQAHWYGIDPIHVRSKRIAEAWAQIMSTFLHEESSLSATAGLPRSSLLHAWKLRIARPERMWLAGIPLSARQPSAILKSGSTIELY